MFAVTHLVTTLKRQIRHNRFTGILNYLDGSIFVLLGLKPLIRKRGAPV